MSERIKEITKKMSDIKRQSEVGSSNSNQLEERKIWKKLEDKLLMQIQNVDDSCTELWQHNKQYKDILKQQDVKFEQLK